MRAAYAILIAFLAGGCFAGIDLLATLTPWNHTAAQVIYYASLDGLVLLLSFLLTMGQRKWWLTLLLFLSVFFAIQSLWNICYFIIAYYTGTIVWPLNLGLGNFVNPEQYAIGMLVQLFLSFLFYVVYRIETPQ